MKALSWLSLPAFLLILGSQAHAESCSVEDSEDTCRDRVLSEFQGVEEKAGAAKEAAKEELLAFAEALSAKNTGGSASTPETATSFSDFFTLLKASADSGSTGGTDDEALNFELSRCLREAPRLAGKAGEEPTPPDLDPSTRLQCQVRLRVGDANLYQPVKNALPDSVREARSKELESGLELGDTLTAGVFLNLVGDDWGRVPRFATEPLFADIWKVVFTEESPFHAASRKADEEYEDLRDQLSDQLPAFDAQTKFKDVGVSPDLARRAIKAREESWRAEFRSMDNVRNILLRAKYLDLVDLVNNQPQLNFGVEYTQRDDLAGPDEWRARLVYERGIVNVNTARAFSLSPRCRSSELGGRDAAGRLLCLAEYLDDPGTQKRLKGGDRFAASLEFVRRDKYRFSLPNDGVDLHEDAYNSYIGSVAYGFYIAFDKQGDATSRVDVKASYEDVSDDPNRQDRGLVVATLTQRILGKQLVALSLVYATKPEFRGEVDEEISARLGFNYKWGNVVEQ
jgi:hypothetical protein